MDLVNWSTILTSSVLIYDPVNSKKIVFLVLYNLETYSENQLNALEEFTKTICQVYFKFYETILKVLG